MPHLIEPFHDRSYQEALSYLETAHNFIVMCAKNSLRSPDKRDLWGTVLKRQPVKLRAGKPPSVGKSIESLTEVINIAATVERLIASLRWLSIRFPDALVKECHPSTSDTNDGSDLILGLQGGRETARAEVSDVVSETQDSNSKEKSDLERLGCADFVPTDGIQRFLITSPEFGRFLTRQRRRWGTKHYEYLLHEAGDEANTRILEIIGR